MEDNIFDQKSFSELPPDMGQPRLRKGLWQRIKEHKLLFSAIVAGIFVLLIFWYFISGSGGKSDPVSNNVILLVKGPEQLASGNEAEYKVIYRNGEDGDMIGVSLDMIYPSNFKFKTATPGATTTTGQRFNLPLVKEGAGAEVVIRGQLVGGTGEVKEIKAKLSYKLSNFNSEFSVEQSIKTEILAPKMTMDITGPVEVISGQDVTFTLNYTNVSGNVYDNAAVRLTYPSDFKFTSATPAPNQGNNVWSLGKLPADGAGKIEVTGSFVGTEREEKLVVSEIGQLVSGSIAPLVNSSAVFKIVKSPLSLTQSANPSSFVNLGDNIQFTLAYANEGSIGMTNAVISVSLEGIMLDLNKISASDAVVTGNTLTWKAATYPNLNVVSPNERGTVSFTVPVKQSISNSIKNQVIKSSASIYSAEMLKPVRSNDVDLKVQSKVGLSISGDYVSGALPMTVGSPTTFSVTMLVTNLSNDAANTELIASIPLPSSAWNNVIVPDAEKARLSYDANSGKIRWKIGTLPAFTGKYTPALIATFQLTVTPTEADRGQTPTLLKDVGITAKDAFTEQDLKSETIPQVRITDLGDDAIDSGGSSVQ